VHLARVSDTADWLEAKATTQRLLFMRAGRGTGILPVFLTRHIGWKPMPQRDGCFSCAQAFDKLQNLLAIFAVDSVGAVWPPAVTQLVVALK
jgi:hypothetical protein